MTRLGNVGNLHTTQLGGDPLPTLDRVTDMAGDHWPITGLTCSACHWPLDPVLRDDGAHPNCTTAHTEGQGR